MTVQSSNNNFEYTQHMGKLEKAGYWIHQHPTTTKVANIALLVLGLGMLAFIGYAVPALGLGAGYATLIGVPGSVFVLASIVALIGLDIIAPPHHDMKNHAFKPGKFEVGELYYDGDVPILSIESEDPFKAGRAQGYLCGSAMNEIAKRLDLVLHTINHFPRASEVDPKVLQAIRDTIPPQYLLEMQGIIDGYSLWVNEHSWQFPKKMTLDDLLLIHLMPDSMHFSPEDANLPEQEALQQLVACTSIVGGNKEEGFKFVRNMDWPSFGLAGRLSIVFNRRYNNGEGNTVEVGLPGFVGTLTGMNKSGLSLAMNVCAPRYLSTEIIGMPACIYNRFCLDSCKNTEEVRSFIKTHSPLGPYHLTTADPENAVSFHFYQGTGDIDHTIRTKEDEPLITLNCRYDMPMYLYDMNHSVERQRLLDTHFQEGKTIEDALKLNFVNNPITTHSVVMNPKSRSFKVGFDNAFAASAPLSSLSTEKLFELAAS